MMRTPPTPATRSFGAGWRDDCGHLHHAARTNDPVFFAIEAVGLRWLADAGPGSARVVRVVDVSPEHILLERVTPTRPTRDAAEAFGRALAVTHGAGAEVFGAPPDGWSGDGYIGRQPLSMRLTATWGQFYAEQRVLPYARRAQEIGNLSRRGGVLVERVCERLVAGQFDDGRSPARIHGDLWSGNVIFTAEGGHDRPGRKRRPWADRSRHAASLRYSGTVGAHRRVCRGRRARQGLGELDRAASIASAARARGEPWRLVRGCG